MIKSLFLAVFTFICMVRCFAGDAQKIPSKVQKVIVFLNGAQVTRTATVNIPAGTSTLSFENLSPNIDAQSIQVNAGGEFTILSVKNEINYLNEQIKQKQTDELRFQQKLIRDKLSTQNSLFFVNQEEGNMLAKNQVVSGQNTNLDVIRLKQALDFQTARLTEIKKKERAITDKITELNIELQRYNRQIADIYKSGSNVTSNIMVIISSKSKLQSNFTLTYVVNNASWYPTYDIRAQNVNSPITIFYKANVSQQSGEEWKDIKLTLSTGNPGISGSRPVLNPYYLSLGMYPAIIAGSISKVTGRVFDRANNLPLPGAKVKVKGTSVNTVTNTAGNYSIQLPAGGSALEFNYIGYENKEMPVTSGVINAGMDELVNELHEVVTGSQLQGKASGVNVSSSMATITLRGASSIPVAVNQTETQTNVEFNIDNPYTIPGDGKQYSVEIDQVTTAAKFQYYTAPKLSTDVFLTARITDWTKYNFLSGEANLFFEGTFIGKSVLDTRAANDTLSLSLGVDKNIVVKRILQKDLNEKQGLLASGKKETRDWLITIKNRKNQQVNLLVEDQVPVSQNAAIEIDTQETGGAEMDKLTGKLMWTIQLNPLAEKKLRFKYQVKYPKNQTVIVQ